MANAAYWITEFKNGVCHAVAARVIDDERSDTRHDILRWLDETGPEAFRGAFGWSKLDIGIVVTRGFELVPKLIEQLEAEEGLLTEYITEALHISDPIDPECARGVALLKEDPQHPSFHFRYSERLEKALIPLVAELVWESGWWKANSKAVKRIVTGNKAVKQVMTE